MPIGWKHREHHTDKQATKDCCQLPENTTLHWQTSYQWLLSIAWKHNTSLTNKLPMTSVNCLETQHYTDKQVTNDCSQWPENTTLHWQTSSVWTSQSTVLFNHIHNAPWLTANIHIVKVLESHRNCNDYQQFENTEKKDESEQLKITDTVMTTNGLKTHYINFFLKKNLKNSRSFIQQANNPVSIMSKKSFMLDRTFAFWGVLLNFFCVQYSSWLHCIKQAW